MDALHLAFASVSKVDYFCTCDDKLFRNANKFEELNTTVTTPTQLVMELDI